MESNLAQHYAILIRTGVVSIIAGIIGGSAAFLLARRAGKIDNKNQIVFYFSKIATGFFSAYLAMLSIGLFNIPATAEMEQAIAILAAMLGSDFIAMLSKRIFGQAIDFTSAREEMDKKCKEEDKKLKTGKIEMQNQGSWLQ